MAGAALASGPGVMLNTGQRFETTNCAAAGSSIGTVPQGKYLLRVTDEDTFICYAGACVAPDGEKFPAPTVMLIQFRQATQLYCRSVGATGDVILTYAD